MASSSRKDGEPSMFVGKKPRFFRIILLDIIHDRKLPIPKKFLKSHGNGLGNQVFLKVPTGATWKIGLRKLDGELWLQKGWQEFAEFYSLAYGHMLVFEYQGNCHFHVLIFNMSTTEIDYPSGHPEIEDIDDDREDEDVEIIAELPLSSCKRTRGTTSPPSITQNEMPRERVHSFQSENPIFTVTIHPSYLRCGARINYEFAKRHLQVGRGKVILQVLDGRSWTVVYDYRFSRDHVNAKFSTGWLEFVRQNFLEADDVCVFELIQIAELRIQVTIFRANKDANGSPASRHYRKPICEESVSKQVAERLSSSASSSRLPSTNPSFTFVVTSGCLTKCSLTVPSNVADAIDHSLKEVALIVENTHWTVTLLRYLRQSFFSAGWARFSRDNFLKKDDICVFELVDGDKGLLEVSISRASECQMMKTSTRAGGEDGKKFVIID